MDLNKKLNEFKRQLRSDIHDTNLHYIAKIDRLMKFKKLIGASERDLAKIVDLSKTEVNRMSKLYRLPHKAKIYAAKMDVEKWAMVEITKLSEHEQNIALKALYAGKVKTRQDVLNMVVRDDR